MGYLALYRFWAVLLMLSSTLSICHLVLTAYPAFSGILLRSMCAGKVFFIERGQLDVLLCILQRMSYARRSMFLF